MDGGRNFCACCKRGKTLNVRNSINSLISFFFDFFKEKNTTKEGRKEKRIVLIPNARSLDFVVCLG